MILTPIQANMREVDTGEIRVLFSYKTPVALFRDGIFYRTAHKWSKTTTRHINRWLHGSPAQEKSQSFFDNALKGVSLV